MIQLTKDLYLGRGRTRECYIDPRDPGRCVKVDFTALGFHQTEKEAGYYRKLARMKPELRYDFIPRFYGMVETDHGPGGVFDLVTDEGTGKVSRTMRHFLLDGSIARDHLMWAGVLTKFLGRLLETGVIVRDLSPGNLCAKEKLDGTFELVAIDGIGHRDFLPLCDYSIRIARRKLRRIIDRKHLTSITAFLKRNGQVPADSGGGPSGESFA